MDEAKHTPGPWRIEDTNGARLSLVAISDQSGANGNTCTVSQIAGPDRQANARLIAAAPDMLAALKAVDALGMLNPTGSGSVEKAAQAVRAAISKAQPA